MNPIQHSRLLHSRRQFLGASSYGLGTAALAGLLANEAVAETPKTVGGLPGLPHFAPKAKRVVYLMQGGAPSHIDLFDHKPELYKRRGEELPASVMMGQRLTTMTAGQKNRPLLPGISGWKEYGKCGIKLSDFLPHTGSIADEAVIIKSMYTEAINHAPAVTFLLTGAEIPGRPSLGAWLSYGLGSLNENLPSFVVLHLDHGSPWVYGVLVNNVWSLTSNKQGGSYSNGLIQPFVNYNFEGGFYLTSAPIATVDWKAEGSQQWTVPIGGGVGKIFHIGKLPVNTQISAYYNVVKPDFGANWQIRAQIQLMFPK
jgi:hypothetical protein